MEITREDLRRHYDSLSDEALLELDRSQLTDLARACYDEELARRGLEPGMRPGAGGWDEQATAPEFAGDEHFEPEEDWLEDAVCVCAFESHHDMEPSSDADHAAEVLERANIPCHIAVEKIETPHAHMPRNEYRVMVPGPLSLKAASVLDIEIFNPKLEAEWRTHFEQLTNDELGAFDAQSLAAGLLDRAARLKRAYIEELGRRGIKARPGDR